MKLFHHPPKDLLNAENANRGGREVDSQWNAIEPSANRGNCASSRVVDWRVIVPARAASGSLVVNTCENNDRSSSQQSNGGYPLRTLRMTSSSGCVGIPGTHVAARANS